VAHVNSADALAVFAHEMRQPLSALEALTAYLDLITPEDARIREHLQRMHAEIAHADQVLCEGLRAMRSCLPAIPAPAEDVTEPVSRPLTNAAMASVTH